MIFLILGIIYKYLYYNHFNTLITVQYIKALYSLVIYYWTNGTFRKITMDDYVKIPTEKSKGHKVLDKIRSLYKAPMY